MGYTYTRAGGLCCDNCGTSGGVRKVPCPHGWCPSTALCKDCRTKLKPTMHTWHINCAANSAKATAASEDRLRKHAAGMPTLCSGLLTKDRSVVHALFEIGNTVIGYYMPRTDYDRRNDLPPYPTPDDFKAFTTLTPAPSSFNFADC